MPPVDVEARATVASIARAARAATIAMIAVIALLADTAAAESPTSDGMRHVKSRHAVDVTVERAKRMLEHHGFRVFGVIDHADNAKQADLELPPTRLLVFGNPKGGTPLMRANRLIGIDLPMKLLVWEDGNGVVWISYNEAAYLQRRHHLNGQAQRFARIAQLLEDVSRATAKK